MKKIFNKKSLKILLLTAKYLVFLFLIGCLLIILLFFYYTYDLPRPEKFAENPFIQSTKIYDRTGKVLLYDIYGEERREVVPFDKISNNLKQAVITSEDNRFYGHIGFDIRGIARAILVKLNLKSAGIGGSRSQGGSTITQQLIRSVYLTSQRTLERKVREVVLSVELERRYSKDEIFNWYLNKIPFGQNTYGAEAASRTYFNKSALDISLAEAAALAALIPAPSYYSPYGSHKGTLLNRKDNILERMQKLGFISEEELKQAKEEKINFSEDLTPIKAPHFVLYVKQYLENRYGEDFLKEKGLKVYTTLDWEIQDYAEQTIKKADETNKKFDAHNVASVVIDPKTGEILSLIGSKDYFEKSYPEGCEEKEEGCLFSPKFDVAIMGKRQPGSAFKPFVYATAFKKGYTPETILWDVKTEFNASCNPDGIQEKDIYGSICYHPQNYDEKYRGMISLRNSLAQSLNLPSVKLLYLTGLKDSLRLASDMGITTLNEPDRYGLSLVLGGGEVTLLEMTSAYGIFANEGVKNLPVSILKIEDSSGNILEQNNKESTKVLDTEVTRTINDILSDNSARAPIFGENNALHFSQYEVAAKTGTTEYFNDAWTIGYSPSVVVGIWVGNNNNASTDKKTGIGLAAPIWRNIMEKLLLTKPVENFNKPSPREVTNPILLGQFPAGDPPHSILHYIDKNNPSILSSSNPGNDPIYPFWEQGIQNWINMKNNPVSN